MADSRATGPWRRHRCPAVRRPGRSPFARARGLAVPILLAALALGGCYGDRSASDSGGRGRGRDHRSDVTPAVEIVQARRGALPLEETLNGVVKARNQVAIRPQIEASVREVLVRSGDAVAKGQPLVRLDDLALADQVRQAEANLRLAEGQAAEARAGVAEVEAQVTRTRALAAQKLVPQMQLDTQEAQLDAAQAQAEQAAARVDQARATLGERRSQMAKTVVRSPVAGRVGQRNAEVGMLATPATTLFLVGDFDQLRVEVPLTEAMLGHVEEGTPVEIRSQALGPEQGEDPIRARISRISPFLEEGSFSTTGEIDLENPEGRLRPGMFVEVSVLYGTSRQATLVPASALWEDPETGDRGVYVSDEFGRENPGEVRLFPAAHAAGPISERAYGFRLQPVEVLAQGRGTAGVTGIEPGAWVASVGQHLLHQESEDETAEAETASGKAAPEAGGRGAGGPAATPGAPTAHVRPTTWASVLGIERLQREDLLREFLAKQRIVARALGTEIPASAETVDEVLRRAAASGSAAPPRDTAAAPNASSPGGH